MSFPDSGKPIPEEVYAEVTGNLIMCGFGSIGRGTLPLIDRHIKFNHSRLYVIDPSDYSKHVAESYGAKFIQQPLLPDNLASILEPLLKDVEDGETSFVVNLTVDVDSWEVRALARKYNAHCIDTVNEPWEGFYDNPDLTVMERSNYILRQKTTAEMEANEGTITQVSCCGANPGMVSWFVKQALVNLAQDTKLPNFVEPAPKDRAGWAKLMMDLGVKGVHIAERDTQRHVSGKQRPKGVFWNTWSCIGFVDEGFQPSELGWGSHEKWIPENAVLPTEGSCAAICLNQAGARTRVRTWCPTMGQQFGFLVTHNESVSISEYFTVIGEGTLQKPTFRPTCHYAYHPCDDSIMSFHELMGQGKTKPDDVYLLEADDIADDGIDELGVLLYGHSKNAYWYGSRLSNGETKRLAPHQQATGLQVTSAVLAGMVWAIENPNEGVVETEMMDYKRCLEVQQHYLGPVEGHYTDWTPLSDMGIRDLFDDPRDESDPWQFRNVLEHQPGNKP